MKVSVVRLLALSGLMLAAPLQAAPIGRPPADVSPVVQVQRGLPSSPKPISRSPFEQRLRPPRDFVPSWPGENVILHEGSVTTTKELQQQQQQLEMARRSREKSDPCQEKHPPFGRIGPTIPGLRTTPCQPLVGHNPQ